MQLDLKNIISITDANKNFSKIARLVDQKGLVIVLKNNEFRYVIMSYDKFEKIDKVDKQ